MIHLLVINKKGGFMKKIILIIGLLMFVTGCDVSYKVEIADNNFLESAFIFTDTTKNETFNGVAVSTVLENALSSYIPSFYNPENYDVPDSEYVPGVEFYNIKKYTNNNYKGIEVSYNFPSSYYYRSRMVNECFREITVQREKNIYKLNTNSKCEAFERYSLLNNLTISLKTNYQVIFNNADTVIDNVYTWNINRTNYQNKPISFIFNTEEIDLSKFDSSNIPKEEGENPKEYNWLIVLLCFIAFVSALGIIITYKIRHKL